MYQPELDIQSLSCQQPVRRIKKGWERTPSATPPPFEAGWNPWGWTTWFSTPVVAFSAKPNQTPCPYLEPDPARLTDKWASAGQPARSRPIGRRRETAKLRWVGRSLMKRRAMRRLKTIRLAIHLPPFSILLEYPIHHLLKGKSSIWVRWSPRLLWLPICFWRPTSKKLLS